MSIIRLTLISLVFVILSGCTTVTRTTYESDPASVAAGVYWAGVFWTVVAVGAALSVIAWAIAYWKIQTQDKEANSVKAHVAKYHTDDRDSGR